VAQQTIKYNAENMPTRIIHAVNGTTDFKYDADAKRAKKIVPGGATYYINDKFEVQNGVETKYIFAGNLRIAKVKGSVLHYFHKDHLGSSTAMSDANGVKVECSEYLTFGHEREHTGTTVSDYKFTDQEKDTSTGLYNYNARLYGPVVGWFVTADSIVPDLYDPQSLNRYSYCINNPLIYTDPTGNEWFKQEDETYTFGSDYYGKNSPFSPGKGLMGFFEDNFPNVHTFSVVHDDYVDDLTGVGVPRSIANFPTMLSAFEIAFALNVVTNILENVFGIVDGLGKLGSLTPIDNITERDIDYDGPGTENAGDGMC